MDLNDFFSNRIYKGKRFQPYINDYTYPIVFLYYCVKFTNSCFCFLPMSINLLLRTRQTIFIENKLYHVIDE